MNELKITTGVRQLSMILISLFCLSAVMGCASESKKQKELSKADRARMLVEVANGALVEGDPTGALQSLSRAEEYEANLPELHHSKALAFFAKHDLNAAIQAAKRAVQLKPNYSDANNTLGKLLMDAGNYSEAERTLQLAAQDPLYREAYKAWTNLGILKFKEGRYIQSEAFLDRAIQDAPVVACVAYYYRGQIKTKDGRVYASISDFEQASKKVCTNYGEAQFALGLGYLQSRQYQQARKTFLEIQKRYPNTQLAEKALDQLRFLP